MGDWAGGALAAVEIWDAWLVARSLEGGLYCLCFVPIHWALCWGIDFERRHWPVSHLTW
jgi:hypothetical protein